MIDLTDNSSIKHTKAMKNAGNKNDERKRKYKTHEFNHRFYGLSLLAKLKRKLIRHQHGSTNIKS